MLSVDQGVYSMEILEYIFYTLIVIVTIGYGFDNPRICPRCRKRKSFYETGIYNKKGLAQYRCRACHYETFSKVGKTWDHEVPRHK